MTETHPTMTFDAWAAEVRRLAEERDAVILAHNYQVPWIQDVAHHVGDSLALSRIAADTDASTIVFCGVHFMAETAKLLSPEKDRKSTRLNSSHMSISYAVFCLKKKKKKKTKHKY